MKKIKLSLVLMTCIQLVLAGQVTKSTNIPTEENISIKTNDIFIEGTLSKPENTVTKNLVILVAGSGPTDRDGNQMGMQSNCYKYIADSLSAKGITVFRYDKRAIGKSSMPNFDESKLRIEDFSNDLKTIVKYFQDQKSYSKIFVCGHSEGSLIGLIALQDIKADGFISLEGAGFKADQILKTQLKDKLPENVYGQTVISLDSLSHGFQVKNYPPMLISLFRPSVQPYLISWFKFDPADLISKLDIPVLIIQGTKDIQVSMEDANKLAGANPKAKLVVIENMNHIGKTITGDLNENMASYTNPNLPISGDLVKALSDFIK